MRKKAPVSPAVKHAGSVAHSCTLEVDGGSRSIVTGSLGDSSAGLAAVSL